MADETTTHTEQTQTATDTADQHYRRDRYMMGVIGLCVVSIAGIATASFTTVVQDWQLAKDALTALSTIAGSLATGYFALQKASRP